MKGGIKEGWLSEGARLARAWPRSPRAKAERRQPEKPLGRTRPRDGPESARPCPSNPMTRAVAAKDVRHWRRCNATTQTVLCIIACLGMAALELEGRRHGTPISHGSTAPCQLPWSWIFGGNPAKSCPVDLYESSYGQGGENGLASSRSAMVPKGVAAWSELCWLERAGEEGGIGTETRG